jgi:hypothetical protein
MGRQLQRRFTSRRPEAESTPNSRETSHGPDADGPRPHPDYKCSLWPSPYGCCPAESVALCASDTEFGSRAQAPRVVPQDATGFLRTLSREVRVISVHPAEARGLRRHRRWDRLLPYPPRKSNEDKDSCRIPCPIPRNLSRSTQFLVTFMQQNRLPSHSLVVSWARSLTIRRFARVSSLCSRWYPSDNRLQAATFSILESGSQDASSRRVKRCLHFRSG